MFSILIPTFNNIEYLKICIGSINKNSKFDHEIIVHVNIGNDGTIDYLKKNKILYTFTNYNAGICEGINLASEKATKDYILYSHDDFYFCPDWDTVFEKEILNIKHNKFYLSGSMIGTKGEFSIECGETYDSFNEVKILKNYKNLKYRDFQGSTWAPHLIHKEYWKKVNGFSEEFFPGSGSDPDFNFKLWKKGIRIFKGLGKCKVYHFGSKTLRKSKNTFGSFSSKLFLLKWGISIKFFKKFYLRSMEDYNGELDEPYKDLRYYLALINCKIQYLYLKTIYGNLKKFIKNK
jgi:glycosyltransferase involved in cell wall biosynthesis